MYAVASRSDEPGAGDPLAGDPLAGDPLADIRARGLIDVSVAAFDGVTRRVRVREEGALRLRFPREAAGRLDAVFVNVAGGMAGGDTFDVALTAGPNAHLMASSAAAEKVYRALGRETRSSVRLTLEDGALLAFLPQETILFDAARIARSFEIDMHANARLVICDLTILGRAAMGEDVRTLSWRDRWRLRWGGRLVWADATRIEGDAMAQLAGVATGGAARAFGALLYAAPGAREHCEALRARFAQAGAQAGGCEAAVTSFDDLLVARFVAQDGQGARAAMARALAALPDAAPPRSWST